MSQIDNIEALERQLAELQMAKEPTGNRPKKIPPAVPPKKKAQPQVPHSSVVSSVREPSYSTKISPLKQSHTAYDVGNNDSSLYKHYANVTHSPNFSYQPQVPKVMENCNRSYSNMSNYQGKEDVVPPPLPPPPANLQHYDSNENHEEYLPPPSPVSSNYSELMRATNNMNFNQDESSYPPIYQNEYPLYGASHSSTYEPLYEPINPRPHSGMSTHTTNSLNNYGNSQQASIKSPLAKEEEVDALTNLLVESISDSQDLDIFGTCVKCNGKVGTTSGCTAMGNVYHVKCFSCHICNTNLQGRTFYAVEGFPYCELDYLETLEKCSVCDEPILDRILRATGKPYHPACFSCVVCGKSLDGVPFTVDAMNQIHCIEDFHKKFAPRCCVCELPIMPEEGQDETVRVVALDRSFHVNCYCCEDCGLRLSSEAEGRGCYPLDGHILCKNCNADRIRNLTTVMTTDL